ncbi:hypothetical protein CAOG_02079 [Capsaspora owczarzaki ATCC 30864]|uniref:Bifunctional lysine-specific demethylase and histidyl-hydroxylase n=1 Tax=Capsaspora owczarzaki (strain ATCC 30864) TaxID=595528 RepID=A0A0D2VL55_CAPO3|nr:hypothetical protein CAOG_02079 [Capsaspora owczarzaki ATCC 30864]KJE90837.1 hypothetical protein CAOG_002079 [Capsaspora owczarzaki ATCC 30864]|eukprot:XP_004348829.1 hypothetical protein CAOG_02079 [Capsaspora owczarzaki ATCC 30864]
MRQASNARLLLLVALLLLLISVAVTSQIAWAITAESDGAAEQVIDWDAGSLDGSGRETVLGFDAGDDGYAGSVGGTSAELFEYLLHPVSTRAFLDNYWDHSPLVVHRCRHVDARTGLRLGLERPSASKSANSAAPDSPPNPTVDCHPESDSGDANAADEPRFVIRDSRSTAKTDTSDAEHSRANHERDKYSDNEANRHPPLPVCPDGSPAVPVHDYYADLLSRDDIDHPLWFASLRQTGPTSQQASSQEPHATYASGAPLVIDLQSHFIRKVDRLLHYLGGLTGTRVSGFAHLAPRAARASAPRYDVDNLIILQMEGKSSWRLYRQEMAYPLAAKELARRQTFKRVELDAPEHQVVLQAGDLLHVPRGWIYDVESLADDQDFHLTVRLNPSGSTMRDLMHSVVYFAAHTNSHSPLSKAVLADVSQQKVREDYLHTLIDRSTAADGRFRQSLRLGCWGGHHTVVSGATFQTVRELVRILAQSPVVDSTHGSVKTSLSRSLELLLETFSMNWPSAWSPGVWDDPLVADAAQKLASLDVLTPMHIQPQGSPPRALLPFHPTMLDVFLHDEGWMAATALSNKPWQDFLANFQVFTQRRALVEQQQLSIRREARKQDKRGRIDAPALPLPPTGPVPPDWHRWRMLNNGVLSHWEDMQTVLSEDQHMERPFDVAGLPAYGSSEWLVVSNALSSLITSHETESRPASAPAFDQLDLIREQLTESTLVRAVPKTEGQLQYIEARGGLSDSLRELLNATRNTIHPLLHPLLLPPVLYRDPIPEAAFVFNGLAIPVARRLLFAMQFVLSRTSLSTVHLEYDARIRHQEQMVMLDIDVPPPSLESETLRQFRISDVPIPREAMLLNEYRQEQVQLVRLFVVLGLVEVVTL